MSKMGEYAMEEEEIENLSGMPDYEAWIASQEHDASQEALPEHKRDGYAERMYESADDKRKADRERFV